MFRKPVALPIEVVERINVTSASCAVCGLLFERPDALAVLHLHITEHHPEVLNRAQAWLDQHRRWCEAIADDMRAGKCPDSVIHHIQKHAVVDLNKHVAEGLDQLGLNRWAASMRNLLMIFEAYYGVHPTTEDLLERLEDQYRRKPDVRTPRPA